MRRWYLAFCRVEPIQVAAEGGIPCEAADSIAWFGNDPVVELGCVVGAICKTGSAESGNFSL